MKIISGFFKFIAIILMVIIIIATPLAMVARSIEGMVFDEDYIQGLVEDYIFEEDTFVAVAQFAVESMGESGNFTEEEGFSTMLFEGFDNFNENEWRQFVNLIAPPDTFEDLFNDALTGTFDWLNQDDSRELPEIDLDMREIKRNVEYNAVPAYALLIDNLPPCPTGSIEVLDYASGDVPVCRPPEPYYSQALNEIGNIAANEVDRIQNRIDLIEEMDLTDEQQQNFETFHETQSLYRWIAQWSWIFIAFVFLAAVPLGARGFQSGLRWIGWPIVLIGFGTLTFGGFFAGAADLVAVYLGDNPLSELPRDLRSPIEDLITDILQTQGSGLLKIGGIFLAIGLLFLIAAFFVGLFKRFSKRDDDKQEEAAPIIEDPVSPVLEEEADPQMIETLVTESPDIGEDVEDEGEVLE